jgi:hypothetical protein
MASVSDPSHKLSESRRRSLAFPYQQLLRDAIRAQVVAIPLAVLAVAIAALLIGGGAYVLKVTGQPLSILVRDANAIAHQPNYFAALEHAEILLMNGAGWIALFAACSAGSRPGASCSSADCSACSWRPTISICSTRAPGASTSRSRPSSACTPSS